MTALQSRVASNQSFNRLNLEFNDNEFVSRNSESFNIQLHTVDSINATVVIGDASVADECDENSNLTNFDAKLQSDTPIEATAIINNAPIEDECDEVIYYDGGGVEGYGY